MSEQVYEPFTRKMKNCGTSKYNHRHHRHSVIEIEPPMFEEFFKKLDKETLIGLAMRYKKEFVIDVYNKIAKEIFINVNNGITQFVTDDFPMLCNCEDANPFSKLSDDDIRHIERDFKEKGIDLKARIEPNRRSVRFLVKIY